MALVTPIGIAVPAFDATHDQVFEFTVQGGDQVVGNIFTVIDNNTSEIVYQKTVESYVYKQTLPAYTLSNGGYYAFYFQTININGDVSYKSGNITFRTFTQPTLVFTNIPSTDIIESGSYSFICEYNQSEGELLNTLYFYLYDSTKTQIKVSNVYTSTASPPVQFTHQFTGFTDDERYYVRAVATTIYNTVIDTGYILIDVNYSYEGAYFAVIANNNPVGGYVQISNNISEIDGQVYDKDGTPIDPTFLDSNSLLLDNGDHLVWSDGYSFANNRFSKQKWWTPIWWGQTTKMSNYSTVEGHEGDGNSYIVIEFKRGIPQGETEAQDYLVAKGYVDGVQYFTKVSNFTSPLNNLSQVTSCFTTSSNITDLILARIGGGHTLIWNGMSDIQYGVFTNMTWVGEGGTVDPTQRIENIMDFDVPYSNVEYAKITDMFWMDEPQAPPVTEVDDLHPTPSVRYLSNVRLDNGIVRDWYVTHDVSQQTYLDTLPEWDNYTIMRATFDDNLRAGNVDWLLGSVNRIKIKRRKVGANEPWITLYVQPIETEYDLSFYYRDYYCPSGYQFEYAMVPCVNDDEQTYFTTIVKTYFDGIFISDKDKTMKLYSNYLIGQSMDNILIGQLQPYNQIYPIIIKNPNVQFRTITIQGDVLGLNNETCQTFELTQETRPIIVDQKREWDKFLCNGKAKIIKDWNGNILLGKITTAPSYTYDQTSGNGKPTMTFGATEVGEYDNQWYMYNHGLIDVEVT
jgi:hypothetical protein